MMFDELRESFVAIRRSFSTFLIMLLCVDLAFTGISAIGDAQGFAQDQWHVSFESSYPERYQYAKQTIIVLLCGVMTYRGRSRVYLGWAGIFLYLLLDDSLAFYERLGRRFAIYFNFQPTFGLRRADFGELLTQLLPLEVGVCLGTARSGQDYFLPVKGFQTGVCTSEIACDMGNL